MTDIQNTDTLRARIACAIVDPGNCPKPNDREDRLVTQWQRDAVFDVLIEDGWVILGVPPVKQVLADARQFSDELVLTKLVSRFFRVMILGALIMPETPGTMTWLKDYIDGSLQGHGPLGKPMIWPEKLTVTCQLMRDWGFQPTPTVPAYVSLKPGGVMAPVNLPEPEARDPRSIEPMDFDTEFAMGELLDTFTEGVTCSAFPRSTVLRAMAAAFAAGEAKARDGTFELKTGGWAVVEQGGDLGTLTVIINGDGQALVSQKLAFEDRAESITATPDALRGAADAAEALSRAGGEA